MNNIMFYVKNNIMKTKLIIILIVYFLFSSIILSNYPSLFLKQLIWYALGILIVIFMKKKYIKYVFYLYLIFNVLLLYLLLFGSVVNGSKAWINIMGITFQPSEFMKIILIILLSIVSIKCKHYKIIGFIITLIPSILTFFEPDTGNVIFYFIIYFSVIIYHEEKFNKLFKIVFFILLLIASFIAFYFINKEIFINIFGESFLYRMDRIYSLFNNSSFQLKRSLINIGSSAFFGSNIYLYTPEETTDFAFSYLIHHIGFIGISAFLLFNLYVNILLLNISKKSSGFISIISFSTLLLKIAQESIHELMGLGLFPITGITLPFISYGGSSVLSFVLIFALIFSKDNMVGKGIDNMDMVGT